MHQRVITSSSQMVQLLEQFSQQQGIELGKLAVRIGEIYASGGQLLLAGNGNMQTLSQLLASHFTYRLGFDRPVLPAVALGSDPVLANAMAGSAREQLLVRQYRSLNCQTSLLLLFSDGTGNAALRNLLEEALEDDLPVAVISTNRQSDSLCRDELEFCLSTGASAVSRQLELALFAGHTLCELVEAELFGV